MYYSRVIYIYIYICIYIYIYINNTMIRVFVCRCMHCNIYTPPLIYVQHEDAFFRAESCW